MTFDEVLSQVQALLQREQRVSYRGLKRRFALDDEYLEDLKEELIGAKRLATDEDGRFLVWTGAAQVSGSEFRVPSSLQSPTPSTQHQAERRQLTVMFCDLVGSTTLSTQLDPEELREVVRAYQQTSATVIERFGGHIAQYLGDGLLVYFGYPIAHEDDAARAVRAGLEIISSLRTKVPSPLVGEGQGEGVVRLHHSLPVRIGIHTGPVVVGEIGGGAKRELLALGETPNIAARVQGQANPDEVVMSAATYRLVEGLFVCEDRGQPELKGVATPLTLYRVVKEGEAQSRFQVVVRKGLTPLVGREHEYGLLRDRWQRVQDGAGQIVLLSGEPGIGKSRLVEALKERVEHEGTRCLELRCSPYGQNSALQPVIEHLQRLLHFRPDETPERKVAKLHQALSQSRFAQPETLALFTALLSLPLPAGVPPLTLSPQKQKEKTNEALVAWLCEEATHQAVTYAWEDLHWADPSTLELLTLWLAQVPTKRLLAVLTYRPEFTPPWGSHSYVSQLTLSRLGQIHVETMVEKVSGGKTLPKEVVQQIVSKTDGVPLFVEELTKSVMEAQRGQDSGDGGQEGKVAETRHTTPLRQIGIPATLQDALMARLDRLGAAKEIAQLGATLGREFNYELLNAISPLPEEALQQGLRQLVEAELVYQSGIPPQARYLFKHALVQDTAYQSLLKSHRQQLHQQITQVLEEQFTEVKATRPELLAHHYTQAGMAEQAILYWLQAGKRATQRSAYMEAISYCTKGLEVLKDLSDTPERTQQELSLQLALGESLIAKKGFGSPEVAQAYIRAQYLCQQVGETPQLFSVMEGLSQFYMVRTEYKMTHQLRSQCLTLAQRLQDPALLLRAHQELGGCLFMLGEFIPALEHFDQVNALYNPQQRRLLAFRKVYSQNLGAWAQWALGYLDQAQKRKHDALVLARELPSPYERAYALFHTAVFHLYRREAPIAQELSEEAIALATDLGFSMILAWVTITRGWSLAEQGRMEEGLSQMRKGLAALRTTGAELSRPLWLGAIAKACGEVGQIKEGLIVLAEALTMVDKNGERFCEAELYRLKGALTLQSKVQGPRSKVEEAEECFLKAIDIARRQSAKSLELRATTSLARLWQQQGKYHAARNTLSEIYNWFTEGFDTKDLQEAKELLEDLRD